MFANKAEIMAALRALGRQLVLSDASEVSLLVCGGSALNCQNLLTRATRDIDVLVLLDQQSPPAPVGDDFTDDLRQAVRYVAANLRLPADWINISANLVKTHWGLPANATGRTRRQEFGPCLTVHFLHRQDLIALKWIAALDKDPEEAFRHFRDLAEMEPTKAEAEFAVAWVIGRPASPEFRKKTRDVAERLGFPELDAFASAPTISSRPRKVSPKKQKSRRQRRSSER